MARCELPLISAILGQCVAWNQWRTLTSLGARLKRPLAVGRVGHRHAALPSRLSATLMTMQRIRWPESVQQSMFSCHAWKRRSLRRGATVCEPERDPHVYEPDCDESASYRGAAGRALCGRRAAAAAGFDRHCPKALHVTPQAALWIISKHGQHEMTGTQSFARRESSNLFGARILFSAPNRNKRNLLWRSAVRNQK